jgi:hypothetical protein
VVTVVDTLVGACSMRRAGLYYVVRRRGVLTLSKISLHSNDNIFEPLTLVLSPFRLTSGLL